MMLYLQQNSKVLHRSGYFKSSPNVGEASDKVALYHPITFFIQKKFRPASQEFILKGKRVRVIEANRIEQLENPHRSSDLRDCYSSGR